MLCVKGLYLIVGKFLYLFVEFSKLDDREVRIWILRKVVF